jgi:hypothetical protein
MPARQYEEPIVNRAHLEIGIHTREPCVRRDEIALGPDITVEGDAMPREVKTTRSFSNARALSASSCARIAVAFADSSSMVVTSYP